MENEIFLNKKRINNNDSTISTIHSSDNSSMLDLVELYFNSTKIVPSDYNEQLNIIEENFDYPFYMTRLLLDYSVNKDSDREKKNFHKTSDSKKEFLKNILSEEDKQEINDMISDNRKVFNSKKYDYKLIKCLSRGYFDLGNINECKKILYEGMKNLSSNHDYFHFDNGLISFYDENFRIAITHFNNSLSIRKDNIDYKIFLAASYYKIQMYPQTIQIINEVLLKDDKFYYSHIIKANAYFKLGKYDAAIQSLLTAKSYNYLAVEANSRRGDFYFYLRQFENACDSYEMAVGYPSTPPEYNLRYCITLCIIRKFEFLNSYIKDNAKFFGKKIKEVYGLSHFLIDYMIGSFNSINRLSFYLDKLEKIFNSKILDTLNYESYKSKYCELFQTIKITLEKLFSIMSL